MLSATHPLAALQAEAALVSGWPELVVEASSEAEIEAARAILEAALGACPQVEVVEPWEVEDPDEPWELRCRLPGLSAEAWGALSAGLTAAGLPPVLVRANPAGVQAAIDADQRASDDLEAGGLVANLWFDADDGGVVGPELHRAEPDAAHAAVELALAAAVRNLSPNLRFVSDAGPDTAEPVIDLATGRRGLVLTLPAELVDPLGGDELHALRLALVEAFAGIIAGQAPGGARLAPDLLWDTRLGLGFVLWWVGAPGPHLPGDDRLPPGVSPDTAGLAALLRQPAARALELHVLPERPEDHLALAEQIAGLADSAGWPMVGAPPRWIRDNQGAARFSLVWSVDVDAPVAEIVAAVSGLAGVFATRVVPGEPSDAGDTWAQSDPGWWWRNGRCIRRVRDGLWEEDRLSATPDRAWAEADEAVERAVSVAWMGRRDLPGWVRRDDGRLARPVRTPDGADGLVFALSPGPKEAGGWGRLVEALSRVRVSGIGPVIEVASGRGATRVLFRRWEDPL